MSQRLIPRNSVMSPLKATDLPAVLMLLDRLICARDPAGSSALVCPIKTAPRETIAPRIATDPPELPLGPAVPVVRASDALVESPADSAGTDMSLSSPETR